VTNFDQTLWKDKFESFKTHFEKLNSKMEVFYEIEILAKSMSILFKVLIHIFSEE